MLYRWPYIYIYGEETFSSFSYEYVILSNICVKLKLKLG